MNAGEQSLALVIADRPRVERAIAALARRAVAELGTEIEIVGIRRRGVPLAHFLAAGIASIVGRAPRIHELGLRRYDDELRLLFHEPELERELDPGAVDGRVVLLVDDVCLSGRTLLAAVQHIAHAGARAVRVAVLCLRDTTEVPIAPDFSVFRLDVGPGVAIEARVPPYEDELAVVLRELSTRGGES